MTNPQINIASLSFDDIKASLKDYITNQDGSPFSSYTGSAFDSLLDIGGDDPACWEGSTISSVWNKPDVKMFMPMGSLVVHMSANTDIPFFISKDQVIKLWQENKTSWSSEQDSQVLL